MDIIPSYRHSSLMNKFRRDINKLFENWEFLSSDKQFFPRIDIKEETNKFIIQAEIPGIDPKNVQVFLTKDNHLVIKGSTESENRTEKEGFLRIERFSGNFYREFPLSSNVKGEEIQANAKRGVLEIMIPKSEADNTGKIIEIKTEE